MCVGGGAGAVLPVIVIIMLVMMIVKFVLAINIISQRKLEVGLSAIAYNAGWTPRGVVLFANNIWVEVK